MYMENYICPICGDIIDSIYDEVNQCLRLSCCGEKYNEEELEEYLKIRLKEFLRIIND